MDNSLTSFIDSANSILILLPTKPSFDTVSAGLSFYLAFVGSKQVTVSCPSPMMVGFNRIIGINKISTEIGNKNLSIKFKGYEASNIEKVSYDIINGEFNLTVVPKVGFTAPVENQVDVSYSGLSADLVILIGGQSDNDFPMLASNELSASKIIHIGIHSFNTSREVLSFAKPGAAISELIGRMIKDIGAAIDPDIATNLVMGIEEGSSNFASTEVTPDTFETFAYLLRSGGRRQSRVKLSPMGFPPGSIPTQPLNIPAQRPVKNPVQVQQPVVISGPEPQIPQEVEANDFEGTNESELDINPPDDWLQPKIFKNSMNPPMGQSDSFSENKG